MSSPDLARPPAPNLSPHPVPSPPPIRGRDRWGPDRSETGSAPVQCPRPADLHYREFGQWWHVLPDGRVVDCDDAID